VTEESKDLSQVRQPSERKKKNEEEEERRKKERKKKKDTLTRTRIIVSRHPNIKRFEYNGF
jgi:hypothetical protein